MKEKTHNILPRAGIGDRINGAAVPDRTKKFFVGFKESKWWLLAELADLTTLFYQNHLKILASCVNEEIILMIFLISRLVYIGFCRYFVDFAMRPSQPNSSIITKKYWFYVEKATMVFGSSSDFHTDTLLKPAQACPNQPSQPSQPQANPLFPDSSG